MPAQHPSPSWRLSERVYAVLLHAYPKPFRDVYGLHMARTFRDLPRDEQRQGGGIRRLVMLWIRALGDLTTSALSERSKTVRAQWSIIVMPVALVMGFAIAFVDSRPNWDDTGITAAALLVTSGLLGVIHPRRPWIWALAVGLWIPALGIGMHRDAPNYGSILALAFAFAGAYAGALARRTLVLLQIR